MILNKVPRGVMLWFLMISSAIFLLGIAGYTVIIPLATDTRVNQEFRLLENSETLDKWANYSDPIFFSVFMFNITNPDEFERGEKPRVHQLGPYVYSQKRTKLIEHMDENTISYVDMRSYHFMPQYSSGVPQSDIIYSLNIPLAAIVSITEKTIGGGHKVHFVQPILGALVDKYGEKLVVQRTVDEMLFTGYETPLVKDVAKLARRNMPDLKFTVRDRFGLFYHKNNTAESNYTVGTGAGPYPFAKILSWNGLTKLPFWTTESCNQLVGTDGSQFPQFLTKDDKLFIFSNEICRSMHLEYEKTTQVKGLETQRFTIPAEFYASPQNSEANVCYCDTFPKCRKGGVIDVSKCYEDAPLLMSAPHFYMAEEEYRKNIDGLNPQKAKHQTFVDISLVTGLVLRGAKRFQINIEVKQSHLLPAFANISDRVIPIGWIEERMEATVPFTDILKERLIKPLRLATLLCSFAALAGALFVIITIICITVRDAKFLGSAELDSTRREAIEITDKPIM